MCTTANLTWVVDPEIVIIEVESRPLLYAKALPEYSNKSLKNDAWEEIAKKLSDNWEVLTNKEKNYRCKDLQVKWRNIRDNFRREYQAQKDVTSAQGAKKRKKYRYYDQLLFLVPHVKEANTSGNYNIQRTESEENTENQLSASHDLSHDTEDFTYASQATVTATNMQRTSRNYYQKKTSPFEQEILKAVKRDEASASDEDRTFCLSLVQSLKKMDDATKMTAKIEILTVIRRFLYPPSNSFPQAQIHEPYNPSSFSQSNMQPHFNQFHRTPTEFHQTFIPAQTTQKLPSGGPSSVHPSKKITALQNYQLLPPSSTTHGYRPQSVQSFFPSYLPGPSRIISSDTDSSTSMTQSPLSTANSPDEMYEDY